MKKQSLSQPFARSVLQRRWGRYRQRQRNARYQGFLFSPDRIRASVKAGHDVLSTCSAVVCLMHMQPKRGVSHSLYLEQLFSSSHGPPGARRWRQDLDRTVPGDVGRICIHRENGAEGIMPPVGVPASEKSTCCAVLRLLLARVLFLSTCMMYTRIFCPIFEVSNGDGTGL